MAHRRPSKSVERSSSFAKSRRSKSVERASKRKLAATTSNTEDENRASFGRWPHSDGRYLGFQIGNNINDHPLRQHKPRRIKVMHQQMDSALEWQGGRVIEHINVEIPKQSFLYTCRNLHQVPHGDESLSKKNKLDETFLGRNIRVVDICNTGRRTPSVLGSRSSSVLDLKVFYRDSDFMQRLNESVDVKMMQDKLFEHLLKKYKSGGGKGSRDTSGVRVDFGLGQEQTTSMMYRDEAGKICKDKDGRVIRFPFCNMKELFEMDDPLQSEITNLLRCVQRLFTFPDNNRRERVGELFRKKGLDNSRMFEFEYVQISLRRADERLNMHMDHKNDRRKGYNHVAVYSYLSADNKGDDFRVAIISTFRYSMGKVMDRIKTTSKA